MDYRPAYQNLLEIFPQVDSRILKAVAFEHPDDVNAAVDFILYEVLPSLNGPSEASGTVHNAHEVANEVQLREQEVVNRGAEAIQPEPVACGTAVSGHSASFTCSSSGVAEEGIIDLEDDNNCSLLPVLEEHQDIISYGSLVKDTNRSVRECEGQLSSSVEGVDSVSVALESANEMSSSVNQKSKGSVKCRVEVPKDVNISTSGEIERHPECLAENCPEHVVCGTEVISLDEDDLPMTLSTRSNHLINIDLLEDSVTEANISTSGKIERHPECLAENCPEHVVCGAEVISLDEDVLPMTLSTRSNHLINIDLLEDSVTEAKNFKDAKEALFPDKILVSAVESVVNMMKEVELLEKRAKQAEEEAANAGQDIVAKAVELKKMLQHAQKANNMHAGEVYGEKAILATEGREFQYRLHNLSEEREKVVSIVEKIHETLEARQASVKDKIAAAELVKLEKVGMAQKVYKEQEAFLDTIVQESKKLQQEAERNTKLRSFLVDHGQVLDTLQGELVVICEDAALLNKLAVNEGASLKGSLLMSTYSSGSLSSSVSRKSISSVDGLLLPMDLVENNRESNGDPWRVQEQGNTINIRGTEKADASGKQKSASDDELKKSVDEYEWRDPLMGSLLMTTCCSGSPSSSVRSVSSTDGVLLPIELVENARGRNEDQFSVQVQENITNTNGSEKANVSCELQKSASDDEWEFLKQEVCPP